MGDDFATGGELREVRDVNHYTGGDACQYQCGDPAGFVVEALTTDDDAVTFVGCRSCLRRARIYPIENEWVDARTETWRDA